MIGPLRALPLGVLAAFLRSQGSPHPGPSSLHRPRPSGAQSPPLVSWAEPNPVVRPPPPSPPTPHPPPYIPTSRQQSLRQKRSRVHCLLVLGSLARPHSPLCLPSFPASSSSGPLSARGCTRRGLSRGASRPEVLPASPRGSAGAEVASPPLAGTRRDRPWWWWWGGPWRPLRGLGGVGRAPEGLTCETGSRARGGLRWQAAAARSPKPTVHSSIK